MDKLNHSQLELFGREEGRLQDKGSLGLASFFKNIRNYEKRVILIISFIFTAVISYGIGVEQGKKSMSLSAGSNFGLAAKENPSGNQKISNAKAINPTANLSLNQKQSKVDNTNTALPNTQIRTQETEKIQAENFTIQLATYKTKTFAQKEADSLKNKGLTPIVLSRSGFSVLCVGRFSNKESAQSLLSQLRKRYPDCHIRRL